MHRIFETIGILTLTDFKLRYANSLLGYLWSLLKPLLIFGVLYVVFSVLMRIQVPNYQLHLLLGIILWNFFAESTMMGMNSLLAKASLITKLRFPHWMLVVSSTLVSLLTLGLNMIVFFVFLFLSGLSLHMPAVLFLVFLAELYVLVLGISFALSVLQVRYRDVAQIWEVFLQAGFFLSPIIYSLDLVPAQYHAYMFLNPITPIVQYSRQVLIAGEWPSAQGNVGSLIITVGVIVIGLILFRSMHGKIAEQL